MSHLKQFEHLKMHLEGIKSITNNFANENYIGMGGFGSVYKGEIVHSTGQIMVAVKRLDRSFGQGDPEFWKEIMTLSLYKHENIISLLGYCDDNGEKILVYEYAHNGSLDMYLDSTELTWIQRLKICIGAAHGLAYLHNSVGTHQRVLHRDIKSSNILLDENWTAKISDFGLSKFGPVNQKYSLLYTNAVVLCGRLCMGNNNAKHRPLIGLARQSYEQNTIDDIVFDRIKDEVDPEALKVFTTISYQCLKRDREQRPLVTNIVSALETALQCQVSLVFKNKRNI
ncbi:putative protein kinase RLK-Pelle-CrRLK1L-1 family [Helianthus debilis subsp. tardiflorus]